MLTAGHDGWDGSDQTQRQQVVGCAGEVVGRREGAGDGIGKVPTQAVQDVESVAQGEESDGEVDGCGVDWLAVWELAALQHVGMGRAWILTTWWLFLW